MSRTPDERLYSSGDNISFAFTQCYVSFGDPDGEDFAFTKCDANGNFTLTGLPQGDWRVTVFDQWNDHAGGRPFDAGRGWPAAAYRQHGPDRHEPVAGEHLHHDLLRRRTATAFSDGNEPGLTLVATNIRFRDGSYSNFNNTDLTGNAGFNEIFPLFSWYVVETDTTRYKNTGIHVVYDAGGPADGTTCGGTTGIAVRQLHHWPIHGEHRRTDPRAHEPARTGRGLLRQRGLHRTAPTPTARRAAPAAPPAASIRRSGFGTEGWQGFSGQNNFLEFGKKPYAAGETGGIHGQVIYASTRPFDDPPLLIHTSWTPDVPRVTINLYQEGTAPDGSTPPHPGRHHQDQQLGRLGAGLPLRWRCPT